MEWRSRPFTNGLIHQCYVTADTLRERAEGSGFEGCLITEDVMERFFIYLHEMLTVCCAIHDLGFSCLFEIMCDDVCCPALKMPLEGSFL